MKELFLEIFTDVDADGTCYVPLETAICLFSFIYCDYPPILLTFVMTSNKNERASIKICISKLMFEVIEYYELEEVARICKLPVIVTCEGSTVVAGLCGVLRQVIKVVNPLHPLLGFKQSCLYACAESSFWTQFCEVDMIKTVNHLYKDKNFEYDCVKIPEDAIRFEVHMSQPVRIHNVQKRKQDFAKEQGLQKRSRLPDSRLDLVQELEHIYAEGPEMTLADIILFPSFFVILSNLGSVSLQQQLPLLHKWYRKILEKSNIKEALKLFGVINKKFDDSIYVHYLLPKVNNQSLYKGDIKKRQPNRHFFTKQEDILECFEMLEELNTTIKVRPLTFGHEVNFDWSTVPSDFRSDDGQIPLKRLERKGQQLENMTKAVLKIARNGNKIVDFCSGSGHLGLVLAHALPRCSIVLLENKEQSLNRARERAAKLNLTNVIFCQSNVDYFKGHFDIGVSLHACGVATDLVMERCILEKASFVCCPCCYGSIQANHMISYPRSKVFQNSRLTLKEYLVLGHSADQTHYEGNVKTSQGNKCMMAIDSDRCMRAKEAGYWVALSKLNPPSCTPKNNLLVGIPAEKRYLFDRL